MGKSTTLCCEAWKSIKPYYKSRADNQIIEIFTTLCKTSLVAVYHTYIYAIHSDIQCNIVSQQFVPFLRFAYLVRILLIEK